MNLYHYTIADRLVKIMIDGSLKLTPKAPLVGERKVVWMTIKDEWDMTAFYGVPLEVLDNAGRIRITIDSEKIDGKLASGQADRVGRWVSLVESAWAVNVDYRDWVICYDRIPLEAVTKIELWLEHDERWEEVPCV